MNKNNLLSILKNALYPYEGIWVDDDKTELAHNLLLDKLEKYDVNLMTALLNNAELKRCFFVEVGGGNLYSRKLIFNSFYHKTKSAILTPNTKTV